MVNVSVVSAKMMHKREGKKFWKTVATVAGNQRKGKGTTYDEAINNVAAYVATFTEKLVAVTEKTSEPASTETTAVSLPGSAENGKALYAVCVSCHGTDGAGNKALNAPRIAGQQVWYVKRQLAAFKSGIRGTHSEDTYGMQMRPMSMTLPDDKAIENVAAYISTLK